MHLISKASLYHYVIITTKKEENMDTIFQNYTDFISYLWGFILSVPGHQLGSDFLAVRIKGKSISYSYQIMYDPSCKVPDYKIFKKLPEVGEPWDKMYRFRPDVKNLGNGVQVLEFSGFVALSQAYLDRYIYSVKHKGLIRY